MVCMYVKLAKHALSSHLDETIKVVLKLDKIKLVYGKVPSSQPPDAKGLM